MKTIQAAAALCLIAGQAGAFEYKAVAQPTNCRPSIESFVQHELGGGSKVVADAANFHAGPFANLLVQWGNGVREWVAVAPTPSGVCIVARQFVSS